MNRKVGMRRLAILLGIVGVLIGGFYSLNELTSILNYYKFNSLIQSRFFNREVVAYTADVEKVRTEYFEQQHLIDSQIEALHGKGLDEDPRRKYGLALQAANFAVQENQKLSRIESQHSEINRAGIKQIQWTYHYANNSIDPDFPWPRHLDVVSIETQDGQTLYPKPAPQIWEYALLILLPVIGFIAPWGIVRGIEWVWTGFSRSPRS